MRAKELYEQGQKEEDISKRPSGPSIDRVRDIVWEFHKERLGITNPVVEIEPEYKVDND